MRRPLLQIALDNLNIEQAIADAKKAEQYLDVIEAGTILIASEGKKAIEKLRQEFPKKLIVADGKIADAGAVFAKMFLEAGADYTTVICAAEFPTISQTLETANKYNKKNGIQIEMTSNFSWEMVQKWYDLGVKQVVWHRSRDSQQAGVKWSKENIDAVKKLTDMGFLVTVTGGIETADIKLFKNIPVYIFIAGRSIRDAADPNKAAKELKDEIAKYWN